jgi:tetratricopeptide (TPR) repeat protein
MARYLFQKGLYGPAWKLLMKAEKYGIQHELFDLLNTIYLLQLEYCHLQETTPLSEIIARYEQNNDRLKQSEKIMVLQAVLKERVLNAKRQGLDVSFTDILTETLSDFKMKRLSRESPKILYTLMYTLRQWVVVSKEFHSFEPLVERSLLSLTNRKNHYYIVQLTVMLAHAKYRTKKFQGSMDSLETMTSHLTQTPVHFQKSILIKVNQLKAANLIFLGGLDESIQLLEELMEQNLPERVRGNIITNLGIYYFYRHDYRRCIQLLNTYAHTDTWYKNHLGIEWLVKRDLMAVLLFNDAGEKDLAEVRIRSIERKYSELFQKKRYERVGSFLGLIKRIVYEEGVLNLEELEQQVEVSWEWVPREEEDLQAMIFYSWLRSKITRQTFYECMVEKICQPVDV